MTKNEKYVSFAVAAAVVVLGVISLVLLRPGSSAPTDETVQNGAQSSSTDVVTTGTKSASKPFQTPIVTSPLPVQNPGIRQPFISYLTPSIGQYGGQVTAWGKNFEAGNTICFYKATDKPNCRIFVRGFSRTSTDLPFVINNPLILPGDYKLYVITGLGASNAIPITIFR